MDLRLFTAAAAADVGKGAAPGGAVGATSIPPGPAGDASTLMRTLVLRDEAVEILDTIEKRDCLRECPAPTPVPVPAIPTALPQRPLIIE